MRIDSHQHFWRYSQGEYPWINPRSSIRRDFLPADLEPELRRNQLDGCVAVQARQTLDETRWLLQLAESCEFVRGVVGWVDLCSPELPEQLEQFADEAKLVGVRHVAQDEPDDRFLMRQDFRQGIAQLQDFGLTYDILVFPRQLPAAIELARAFPEQPFVLDHLAKPSIRDAQLSPWSELLKTLGRCSNVMCKISGLVTEADWDEWKPADLKPYLDVAFEAFGVERLMFGSDWPVALLAGSYQEVITVVRDYVTRYADGAAAQVFGLNATSFYGL